jgi:hypothetical protein
MKLPHVFRAITFVLLLSVIPAVLSSPASAQIGVGISVRVGPPALPIYEQPICPGPGYLWTPGYWAWDDDDGYYWVPGTWVVAPVGLLWTPGYWGWGDGVYLWHGGYWGPHVGFYGGINYGFGYGGVGFFGGEWRGGAFFYNSAVTRVNTVNITNVYVNRTVIVNNNSHVAFNGGRGGVAARPTAQQEAWSHEQHQPAVAAQTEHQHAASQNKALFASNNHGRPAVAATARPGDFSGRGVVKAKAAGATYHAPSISPKQARATSSGGNRTAENRPASASNSKASSSKAANRPFVPPNKSNTKSSTASRKESVSKPSNSKTSSTRPSESHATKPFTPPPSSHASTSSKPARTESAPRTETAHSSSPARPSRQQSAPSHESRPQSAPRPAPQARESAPRPAPRESAPHASAPKPQRESAPPRHEAPPKPEHKGR